MPVTPGFREFVLEQLEQSVRDIRAKSMFGGVGIYAAEHFFALIANDVLYFKVDDLTRAAFTRRRMRPFQPYGPGLPERLDGVPSKETMGYYEVPVGVLEDADELRQWAADAIAVARRAATAKRITPRRPARRSRGSRSPSSSGKS